MQLTAEVLTDRFRKLKSLKLRRRCERVARQLTAEDGVRGALNSFYKQWHLKQGDRTSNAEAERERKLKEAEVPVCPLVTVLQYVILLWFCIVIQTI
jgi:hypothetical protein